jgi:AI-2 transport protein TqsA
MQPPPNQSEEKRPVGTHSRLLNTVLWMAVVFGTLILLTQGKSFFIPIVIALIAVYLVHAVSRMIRNLPRIGRFIPGPVAVVMSFVTIFALGYGLFSIVADNAQSVANEAPKYQARLISLQKEWFAKIQIEEPPTMGELVRQIDIRSTFTTVASSVATLLGNLTLILLYTLFLLIELRFLPSKLDALFPDADRREMIREILTRIDKDIRTYLGVKTLVSLITSLVSYAIMRIVGLDFAEFWALLVFLLNFIPTIGSIFSTLFPTLLALVQFESLGPVLFVAIGITAVQQLMGSILEPNIMGESLNLSPLVVFVSLIMWGNLWGIVGMLLCVPITVILVIILSNFERTRWVAVMLSKNGTLRIHAKMPGSPEKPETSPAKYVNSPETPIFTKGKLLFGLHKTKRALIAANEAIVCEGQFDLITAFERGVENVVAPQGTAFTPQQAGMLKRFVSTVTLCFDSDSAGEKAVERSLPALLGHGLAVRVLELPAGEDPDSLIRRQGGEAFVQLAKEAGDLLVVLARRAERAGQLAQPAALASTARRFAGILRLIPDAVQRDASLNQVASLLRIAPGQLAELLRKTRAPAAENPSEESSPPTENEAPPLPEAIATLCRLALNAPEARDWLRQNCHAPEFAVLEGWKTLQTVLDAEYDAADPLSVGGFLATCHPSMQNQLAALDNRHIAGRPVVAAEATLVGLRRHLLARQRDQVKAKLLQPGLSSAGIIEIQKELLDLQKRLQELPQLAFVETCQ